MTSYNTLFIYCFFVSVIVCVKTSESTRLHRSKSINSFHHRNVTYNNNATSGHGRLHDNNRPKEKLKISVYYETLCKGSIDFLTDTLEPVIRLLGPYLDVHLVPAGFSMERSLFGRRYFSCQHGQEECYGNMLHACALDVISDRAQAALFNICLMRFGRDNRRLWDFEAAVVHCNRDYKKYVPDIIKCFQDVTRSAKLLSKHQTETIHFFTQISGHDRAHVPYVAFENHGANSIEDKNNGDFIQNVCAAILPTPDPCKKL